VSGSLLIVLVAAKRASIFFKQFDLNSGPKEAPPDAAAPPDGAA
jgi:hypothetical protein